MRSSSDQIGSTESSTITLELRGDVESEGSGAKPQICETGVPIERARIRAYTPRGPMLMPAQR